MDVKKETMIIKTKIIGVLLRHARLEVGKSIDDCARVLNCAPQTISDYELGKEALSLPKLELLAEYLHKPLDYFWAEDPLRVTAPRVHDQTTQIRDRIIGVQLRQARQKAAKTIQECAQFLGRATDQIEQYEFGRAAIPIAELEALAEFLNVSINYFSAIPARPPVPAALATPVHVPTEVRDFVADPANLPYLELARHLPNLVHAWQQIVDSK